MKVLYCNFLDNHFSDLESERLFLLSLLNGEESYVEYNYQCKIAIAEIDKFKEKENTFWLEKDNGEKIYFFNIKDKTDEFNKSLDYKKAFSLFLKLKQDFYIIINNDNSSKIEEIVNIFKKQEEITEKLLNILNSEYLNNINSDYNQLDCLSRKINQFNM